MVILRRLQAQTVVNLQHHHRAAGTQQRDRQAQQALLQALHHAPLPCTRLEHLYSPCHHCPLSSIQLHHNPKTSLFLNTLTIYLVILRIFIFLTVIVVLSCFKERAYFLQKHTDMSTYEMTCYLEIISI